MALVDSLPSRKVDTKDAKVSKEESGVLEYLGNLKDEGDECKKKFAPDTDDKDALDLYRGRYTPSDRSAYYSVDFIQAFMDRMVAGLTDNRPVLRVEHRKSNLKATAHALEKVMQGVWLESDMQRQTFKMASNSAIRRSAGMYVGQEAGEPYIEQLNKDQVTIDPQVTEAALVHKAEYVIIERVKTLSELKLKFPGRGALVKADEIRFMNEGQTGQIKTPLTDLIKRGFGKPSKSVIPRAKVFEAFLKDRQIDADGRMLFPYGRRIVYSRDYVLWDGPNPYWDGQIPLDWFDWTSDPEHPWGISAPMMLKRMQLAFNEIFDGTIANTILSNFIQVVGDMDVIDPGQWKNLQKITNSLIIRKTSSNKSFEITAPPVYGLDKMQIARSIFTYAQLLTGVTDVTLGDQPGSIQSGTAIEGLQEAAGLMTRARASRLEDFYTRVGSKLMARILQFWPSDRVFHLLGPTGESIEYAINRAELFVNMTDPKNPVPVSAEKRQEAFKHMRFAILPGSSAPGTRARRAEMMMRLHAGGMASRKEVLQAADFANAEEMLKDAEEDFDKFPPAGFKRVKQGEN